MFEGAKITNKLITNNLRSILEQNSCGTFMAFIVHVIHVRKENDISSRKIIIFAV